MTTTPEFPDWTPCPPGMLQNLAGDLRRQHQWQRLRRNSGIAALVLVGCLTAWTLFPRSRESNYGGVTCTEVKQATPSYLARELTSTWMQQIDEHLRHCPRCQKYVDDCRKHPEMLDSFAQPSAAAAQSNHPSAVRTALLTRLLQKSIVLSELGSRHLQ
ncbi:MAG: zf-HC2 domain-containing protein [Planctomycetaceae bacterium]|nr:zf-HC2 domain-containing protein [Planctomycetaceae bacterium]